jgi:PEP-CTERM motif
MKLRAQFVLPAGLLGLLWLTLPGPVWADTVYTYTGNAYTSCIGSYVATCTATSLSFTFDTTLTGAQLDNLAYDPNASPGNLVAYVTSFSFTDGTATITQANASSLDLQFNAGTGPSGGMVYWYMSACTSSIQCLYTYNVPYGTNTTDPGLVATDASGIDSGNYGDNTNDPGTWTVTSTPEPSTTGLMLLGVGLVLRKRLAQDRRQAT